MLRFSDCYEKSFSEKDAFMEELKDREAHTERYTTSIDRLRFYGSVQDGNGTQLRRLEGEKIVELNDLTSDESKELWQDTAKSGSGLFLRYETDQGEIRTSPVSQNCKLSLSNRTKLTFAGDLNVKVSKLALARLYEDFINLESSKTIQIIEVYGKVQAMMTHIYSPIGHDEFFEKIDERLSQRFGAASVLRYGYVTHKWSRGIWYVGDFALDVKQKNIQGIQLGLSAVDSQTGHSGAILQPCLFTTHGNRAILFDDAWYSKHVSISDESIGEALDLIYQLLNDNAEKLVQTMDIHIENPTVYAKKLCESLNTKAKKMSGTALSGKAVKNFVSSVEGLGYIRSDITVWDIIEILWDLPENEGASAAHKEALMKTVSRVLFVDHAALDAA